MATLYDRIRETAGDDVTDAALSKKADLHREAVRQIRLRCERNPGAKAEVETIDKLARLLNVSFRWLATGQGSPGKYRPAEIHDVASAHEVAMIAATTLKLPPAVIKAVLDEQPGIDDPGELVVLMVARRSAARGGHAHTRTAPGRKHPEAAQK